MKKKPNTGWLDAFLYSAISDLFFLFGLIPQSTAKKIAEILGRVWFVIDQRHREIAVRNLARAFGDQMSPGEIRTLARRIFCNLARIIFEIGWSMHLDESGVRKHIRFSGLENLRMAREKGRGVLILTAHMGNWELLLAAAGKVGLPISAIYRPLDFRPLDLFFSELRSRSGAKLIPKHRGMRKVMESLRKNECVGVLLDQNARGRSGVFVDFFSTPASTNTGLALLARATESPVVPLFLVREADRYFVKCLPELPLIKSDNKNKDVETNTRIYNKVIESIVRNYPDQWFWVHRRWENMP